MEKNLLYKGILVKEKTGLMKLPLIRIARGIALFSKICLRKDLFDKFSSGNPDVETLSVLEHEKKHIERGKKIGALRMVILYWLLPSVRIDEELVAIREEMKVFKNNKQSFDFNKKAKNLSGMPYLWATSYKNAYRRLTKLWEEI